MATHDVEEESFDQLIDTGSDSELAERIRHLRKERDMRVGLLVVFDLYVTKHYDADDIDDVQRAMAVTSELNVNVPAVKRVVSLDNGFECIHARVIGEDLMGLWTNLGWITTLRLAFQLRWMAGKMRRVTSPTAGSLGTGLCRSLFLNDAYGVPRNATAAAMSSIVNFWHNFRSFRKEVSKTPVDHRATCEQPTRPDKDLVFTHNDLAPRNIMLEQGMGKLWVVDWDLAGYYPKYFEHCAMQDFRIPDEWTWGSRLRWKLFSWISTGSYQKEVKMMNGIQRKSIRFPAARRFSIQAGATMSMKPVPEGG